MDSRNFGRDLTELQKTAIDYTNRFDDPTVRYALFAHSYSPTSLGFFPEDIERYPDNLKSCNSSVWIREMTRGYLIYLECIVEKIRGEKNPTLILLDDMQILNNVEDLRSEWLRLPSLRETVLHFMEVLEEALSFFNVQIVAGWMRIALLRAWRGENAPPFGGELSTDKAAQELQEIENAAYSLGKSTFRGKCAKAFEALSSVESIDPAMLQLFIIPEEQLRMIAAFLQGSSRITAAQVVALDPPPKEQPPLWKETTSGIVVPGNLT